MPKYGEDYKAFVKSIGAPVTLILDVHTHPGHSPHPSGHDVMSLYDMGGSGAHGLIITDRGKFSVFSISGKTSYPQDALDKCRTPNVKAPSVRVSFK